MAFMLAKYGIQLSLEHRNSGIENGFFKYHLSICNYTLILFLN